MTATLDDVTRLIVGGVLASTKRAAPRLVTYRHVWTHKDRNGDWQYAYICTWSDSTETLEHTLPWGNMADAVEVKP